MNSDTKIISIIGLITLIIVVAGLLLIDTQKNPNSLPEISINKEALVRPESIRQNRGTAKIQLVEFADFECPACAMMHPSLKRIKTEYKDQIDFVFRVIPIHSNSVLAASAVLAAREQGKMMEMHDVLFEKQEEWTKYGITQNKVSDIFETYATLIGIDVEKYKSDMKQNASAYRAIVAQDEKDASSMSVFSTPTLIVNGKTVVQGVATYEKLKGIIESELNSTSNSSQNTTLNGTTTNNATSTAIE